jgi:hypothetical protein
MPILAMALAVALQGPASSGSNGLCVAPSAPRTAPKLLPRDEAANQPDFFTFRARLLTALAQRDEAAVLAAADPGIRLAFDDSVGIEILRKALRDPQSTIWGDLATTLALGGTFESPTSFTAPYVTAAWSDDFDAFQCAAVLGDRVRVRRTAAADSAVVASVSYEIVQLLPEERTDAVVQVRLANGVRGFISAPFLRSAVDHRAIFDRKGGQWRMVAFVAGD